jgi:uncharacterized membrane protein YphA (DoxX/SURF4 family)
LSVYDERSTAREIHHDRYSSGIAPAAGLPRTVLLRRHSAGPTGGICIALRLFTRFFAAAITIEIGVLTFHTYWGHGFSWTQRGYEYVLLWGVVHPAIALRGGGPYSLGRKIGKEL